MCQTICKNKKNKFFISSLTNPQTIEVCKVRAEPIGVEVIVGDPLATKLDATYMGALIPYPTTCGRILDYSKFLADCKVRFLLILLRFVKSALLHTALQQSLCVY
jgi:glycine dehydrogenase